MKYFLIFIVMFTVGAVLDWNTNKEYSVISGTFTITYRPPTKQEIFDRELSIRTNKEIKRQTEIGQEGYKSKGRNRAYMLGEIKTEQIKTEQVELLMNTTFYEVGISTGIASGKGYFNPLWALFVAIIGFVIFKIFKKRKK